MLAAVMRTRVGGTVGLHVKTEDSGDEVYLRIQATVVSSMHLFLLLRNEHFYYVVVTNIIISLLIRFFCVVG